MRKPNEQNDCDIRYIRFEQRDLNEYYATDYPHCELTIYQQNHESPDNFVARAMRQAADYLSRDLTDHLANPSDPLPADYLKPELAEPMRVLTNIRGTGCGTGKPGQPDCKICDCKRIVTAVVEAFHNV